MSHYTQVKTLFKDRDALVEALENLGYKPEVHDKATNLYGYQGDKRGETAEVIVRRKQVFQSANDLGFKKQADGTYSAVLFDYRRTEQDAILTRVKQQYGVVKSMKALRTQGYQIGSTVVKKDGTIRYVAQRW